MTTAIERDEPVRQRSLRDHNLAVLLRHVAASRGPVSRANLADATGLTKATVSALVEELLSGSLLVEVDPPPRTGAGRPAIGLRIAAHGPAGLGLEINVDYVAACVVDLTGAQRCYELRRQDQRGRTPGQALDDLARLAGAVVRKSTVDGLHPAGIAIGVPGLVADGVVRLAPNLGWRDVDVAQALRQRAGAIGIPVSNLTIDNEANLAALGELHAGPDARASFVYISGEIGVGGGVVLAGQLLRGARGYGGELGHITIRPSGAACRCGARGCLEAYANQEVLLRAAGLEGVDPTDGIARLAAAAEGGSALALTALAKVGSALGVAAADVVNLLDVDTIVLGGIYAPLTPWLREPMSRELTERTITSAWAPVTVRASALGTTATVVGAAGSVIRAVRDAPAAWLAGGFGP